MMDLIPEGILTIEIEDSIDHTSENEHQEMLEIYTLGGFRVKRGDKEISAKARHSAKLWELFKFLLANRSKPLPGESIVEALWPDQEYSDQEAALHTLIHRMRRLFYEEFSKGCEPFYVEVSQGCYCLKLNGNCWLDLDEFAQHYHYAAELSNANPGATMQHYQRALSLYKGEFLPEYLSEKWILPARRYYRNLYLQTLTGMIKLLMDQGKYSAVRDLCKEAFQVEQFMEVEALHLYFMEALYKSGNPQEALCHYDFLTTSLYQEFGAKPSPAMRDLYRRIKSEFESTDLDLSIIDEKLMENEPGDGAFICDQDVFRFLYQLEKRRSEREKQNLVIGLFSITWDDYRHYHKDTLNAAMDYLEKILLDKLRKGDVITRWSESQLLVLLRGADQAGSRKVFSRISKKFAAKFEHSGINLEITRKTGLL